MLDLVLSTKTKGYTGLITHIDVLLDFYYRIKISLNMCPGFDFLRFGEDLSWSDLWTLMVNDKHMRVTYKAL